MACKSRAWGLGYQPEPAECRSDGECSHHRFEYEVQPAVSSQFFGESLAVAGLLTEPPWLGQETGHSHRRLLRGYSMPTRIDVEMAFGVYITSEKGEEALLVNNAVGYLVFQVQQEAKAKIEVGDYNDLA